MPEQPKRPGKLGTYLSLERTLLAWVRTGTALVGLGIVLAKFSLVLQRLGVPQTVDVRPLGTLLIGAGGAAVGLNAVRFAVDAFHMRAGHDVTPHPLPALAAAALVLVVAAYASVLGTSH